MSTILLLLCHIVKYYCHIKVHFLHLPIKKELVAI